MTVKAFDIVLFRNAFAAHAKADNALEQKAAICAELFTSVTTWDELKEAMRNAIYGYIHGREGKASAEQFFEMKKPSDHPLYKVAANAVKRAKDRAEKGGWVAPQSPRAGEGEKGKGKAATDAAQTAPSKPESILSALNKLLSTDPEFAAAMSYAVHNSALFTAWAKASAEAMPTQKLRKAA